MPANLPPQYFEEEERYRAATTPEEKIKALRAMYAVMPKHKGTDKLQADIKRRIARLKDAAQRKQTSARQSPAWVIEKEGAGQIPVLGPPNCGKSALLAEVTNAHPLVTDYPYATQAPLPGMMRFENIQFQLVDTPSVSDAYVVDWLPELLRRADACILLADLSLEEAVPSLDFIFSHVQEKGVYLGQTPPEEESITSVPTLLACNKLDAPGAKGRLNLMKKTFAPRFPVIGIAVEGKVHLEEMKRVLFQVASLVRIYSKEPGKPPDTEQPFVLPKGSTVRDLAGKIHRELRESLKFARIWGSGRFDGQRVSEDHVLEDGDILELHGRIVAK